MSKTHYDCSGYATKADMRCSDGITIRKNAFEECDGKRVPLVWNHEHNNPDAVLGHAILENRPDGVYAYLSFNDTDAGQNCKTLVQHGDIDRLSIWANKLKQVGGDVIHGVIREVSLVLAGANPGAIIDSVMAHGESSDEEAFIRSGEFIVIDDMTHSDKEKEEKEKEKGDIKVEENNKKQPTSSNEKTIKEIFDDMTEEQKAVVYALIGNALEEAGVKPDEKKKEVKHADSDEGDDAADEDETVADVYETLTDKQKKVVQFLIGQALADAGVSDEADEEEDQEVEHSYEEGENNMKHNIFDSETNVQDQETLSHSDMEEIVKDARRLGSMKEAFLAHGITDIGFMFPDAKVVDGTPGFIKRDDTWVQEVMKTVHKTPFARVKSIFADLTEDDARAKGYIKGNQKAEEVFKMLKRETTPTTIYKKQKLDRDDVLDITELDVIAWLKQEMRFMLDEEMARAILVGDGRNSSSNDKINEQNIRPIWTDDDVYTVKYAINITKGTTSDEKAKAFVRGCKKSRKDYKGSGNPVMFMPEDLLTDCLLLEDNNGRVIYDTMEKLATALRVSKIIPVPVMENLSRVKGADTHYLGGLYVNLNDYNVGADKGGEVTMFDDFDIDFNAMKYLMETRASGAMIKPYAAVAIEFVGKTAEMTEAA